jgi:ABC-type dipeptide/oligopeptide/nickel transport system permease subunit
MLGLTRAFALKGKRGDPVLTGAAIFMLLVIIAAIFAPWLSPYDFAAQRLDEGLTGPSAAHWLGQDKLGRDVLSRVIWGARVSLLVGVLSVTISVIVGTTVGLLTGYFGGKLDQIGMRVLDIFLAFPGILLAIALAAVLGPGLKNVVIALSAFGWVVFARLVRSEILSLRERDYVQAAIVAGASSARIMLRHLLPGVAGALVVQTSFAMAAAILAEASLSFLGLGTQTLPSWGGLLNEGAEFLGLAGHLSWAPGLALLGTVVSLNLLGDRLRDQFDGR